MKKKIKALWLFVRTMRQKFLFVTAKENAAMVAAAKHLDTEIGLKMVGELRQVFADLNQIKLKAGRNVLEVKITMDLQAVDRLGDEIACEYLAQDCINKLRGYLAKRGKKPGDVNILKGVVPKV